MLDAAGTAGNPPVSGRDQPRFATRERRDELAAAFTGQGADYDRLRPGYPPAVIEAILAAAPAAPRIVDLGAGTGKLSRPLAAAGAQVTAVDPSSQMLAELHGSLTAVVGTAENTGLPGSSADVITAAQAWHWFDADAASAEAARLLRPGGVLALVWNTLDVQIPWVHRLSRIMHAGDVQKDDFTPPVDARLFSPLRRLTLRWEDPRPTGEIIDLAHTRSYVATAAPERRAKVLANLDWYLHEHLGHAPGETVSLPYRTDLFLWAAAR